MQKRIFFLFIVILLLILFYWIYLKYSLQGIIVKNQTIWDNRDQSEQSISLWENGSWDTSLEIDDRSQIDISTVTGATDIVTIRNFVKKIPEYISFWDEGFGQESFKNDQIHIAYVLETCRRIKDRNFYSFVTQLYSIGNVPNNENIVFEWKNLNGMTSQEVVEAYTWDNYCSIPVFSAEDTKVCHTQFDVVFFNKLIQAYLKKISLSEFSAYLSTLSNKNLRDSFYKDFYMRLINDEITSPDDC